MIHPGISYENDAKVGGILDHGQEKAVRV